MVHLHVLKGAQPGQKIPLEGKARLVLGRSSDCHVVINDPAVSRSHAQIVCVGGDYFIEDLKSRNSTFLNNQPVTTRTPLRDNDRIKICDFICTFTTQEGPAQLLDPAAPPVVRDESETSSTIEVTLSDSRRQILLAQSPERLTFLLDIASRLAQTFHVNLLLPKILDSLFQLFKQTDRGFVLLLDEEGRVPVPRAVQTRHGRDDTTPRFSRRIVAQCLESGHALLSKDASLEPVWSASDSIADAKIRSVMCVPLLKRDSNEPFGLIQLDTLDRAKKFTAEDLKLLVAVAAQAAVAIENAKLYEDMQQREQFERDMALARQVQRCILPEQLPELPGYEFFAHYASALEVGGDYYDFVGMPDGRVAVTIGDVAGKGMPAALLMAKLASDARYCLLAEADPEAAVARLNNLLVPAAQQVDRYATLVAALLDPARQTAALVNAGHLAPLVYRRACGAAEDAMPRDGAGMPVGVRKDNAYASWQVRLGPGDCLLLFTDGVTDAVDTKDRPFTEQRVRETLRSGPFTPRSMGERLVSVVKQHSLGCKQRDDITVVCFGRL
jgi:serine phosphatase RsbU (regulator of sigma subunit)